MAVFGTAQDGANYKLLNADTIGLDPKTEAAALSSLLAPGNALKARMKMAPHAATLQPRASNARDRPDVVCRQFTAIFRSGSFAGLVDLREASADIRDLTKPGPRRTPIGHTTVEPPCTRRAGCVGRRWQRAAAMR